MSPSDRTAPDALQLLIADHREAKAMFERYGKLVDDGAGADERMLLAAEVCVALSAHMVVEEEILYPAAREALPRDQGMVDEAEVEHASAKGLIEQIKRMDASEPMYDARVHVLGEYIDHHVHEEEDDFFPKLRRSGLDLRALGAQIAARKAQWMAEAAPQQA